MRASPDAIQHFECIRFASRGNVRLAFFKPFIHLKLGKKTLVDTKTETAAFAAIGKALTEAKDCAKSKKENLPLVSAALAENHDDLAGEGVTIGDYKFKIVVREELTAIRV